MIDVGWISKLKNDLLGIDIEWSGLQPYDR